ncbi:MAG: amidohydrolase family protein [Pseudomonadota bacterium]
MKRLLPILAALLCASPAVAETLAITGVTAWTMTGRTSVADATIVIADGHIRSVVAKGAVPDGARVILGKGRVVTPALIDPATQIGLGEVGGIDEERGSSVGKGPLGAAFDVSYALDPNAITIQQARADGLAHGLLFPDGSAGAPFDGAGMILRVGATGASVERSRAAIFATVGAGGAGAMGGSRAAAWLLLRNAIAEARLYRTAPRGTGPRDQLLNHLDAEALAPLLAGTVPLVIQTDRLSDIRQAMALAREERIRVVVFGGGEAWAAAAELAAARIPVILDPFDDLPVSYDKIGARRDNAALLARAGVPIAFSVSAQGIHRSWNAAPAMREGAGYAVAAGLPYVDALAAITTGPARIMGLPPGTGTLAPGTAADLVLWDGDPLEPTSAPAMVLLDGREISLVTRQTMLRDRYAPHR